MKLDKPGMMHEIVFTTLKKMAKKNDIKKREEERERERERETNMTRLT